MTKPESHAISFRIEEDKLRKLEDLASATDRSRSWHIEQALEAYLEAQAWQIGHMEKGIADLEAGRTAKHADVRDWLLSWGTDEEREPPR